MILAQLAHAYVMILRLFNSIVVFLFVFFLSGWFLMPHLPPFPLQQTSIFELNYWTTNWAGAILGTIASTISHMSWKLHLEQTEDKKSAAGNSK